MKLTVNKDLNNIHFVADMHFNHENIIRFCKRPYKSVNEMNDDLIHKWNKQVKPEDTVFHLGDFSYKGSPQKVNHILSQLNGNIVFIIGNHEQDLMKSDARNKNMIEERIELNIEGVDRLIVLDHYPMLAWNKSHSGSIQLFGHVHGGLSNKGVIEHRWNQMDVGIDATKLYRPITANEALDFITMQYMETQNKITI